MYPHFIEVHDIEDGSPIAINIDSIACVMKGSFQDTECGLINCRDAGGQVTKESYDELKELIRSAGCHIEKGDPRLDQSRPLTMDDLKDMVGQPVWDSNTDTWLLVYEGDWTYTPDPDRVCVRVVNRYGCNKIWLSEKDLIAKPLYMMKRNEDRIYIPDGYVRERLGSKNHD